MKRENLYTISQASKRFGVPRSSLGQAIVYGQIATLIKADPQTTQAKWKDVPRHYVSHDDMLRFLKQYRSEDYNAPGFISDLRHTRQPRRPSYPMSPEELATRAARDVVDDRNAAQDLSMTLAEYREVAL